MPPILVARQSLSSCLNLKSMIWLLSTCRGVPRLRRVDPDDGAVCRVPPLPPGTTHAALLDAVAALARPGDVISAADQQVLVVMRPGAA